MGVGVGPGKRAGPRIALAIVLVFCAMFALRLGFFSQEYYGFERTHSECYLPGSCAIAKQSIDAYANGGDIVLYAKHAANASLMATFDGSGKVETAAVGVYGGDVRIARLFINGKLVCQDCQPKKKYPVLGAEGRLDIATDLVLENAANDSDSGGGFLKRAFFDKSRPILLAPEIWISARGGWKAAENAWVPSSFYGVDAPFHIHRTNVLADHLARLEWPWSFYSFFSMVPPALYHLASGISAEYAYRQYSILLFFAPVCVFYFFSRKMKAHQNGSFLFSSLCYLFLPSVGLLVGGGSDIFFYGMVPHTLATCLSLVFMYFAYEYVIEEKRGGFLPAVLFFFLSALSNPRVLFALPFVFLALFSLGIASGRMRRVALLAISCAAAIAWVLAPAMNIGLEIAGYGTVGGAMVSQTEQDALLGFFQIGHVLLPILFAIGLWKSYQERWAFPFFLATAGIATYVFVANPDVNRAFPFIDGVRLLPSFFLPAFFVAGAGMAAIHSAALFAAGGLRRRLGWDELTFAGAVAFSVLLPLAFIFAVVANSTMEQYNGQNVRLRVASEYFGLERAYRIIGSERVAFCGASSVSQHLVYEPGFEQAVRIGCSTPDKLVESMNSLGVRYMLYGNVEMVKNGSIEPSIWEIYENISEDPRFASIDTGGTVPLFLLRNASGSGIVDAKGATLTYGEVGFDRARFEGSCDSNSCEIFFASPLLQANAPLSSGSCDVNYDKTRKMWKLDGIPRGKFAVEVSPKPPDFAVPLAVACIAIALMCYWLSGLTFFEAKNG